MLRLVAVLALVAVLLLLLLLLQPPLLPLLVRVGEADHHRPGRRLDRGMPCRRTGYAGLISGNPIILRWLQAVRTGKIIFWSRASIAARALSRDRYRTKAHPARRFAKGRGGEE